jgi:hypothetical protein
VYGDTHVVDVPESSLQTNVADLFAVNMTEAVVWFVSGCGADSAVAFITDVSICQLITLAGDLLPAGSIAATNRA